MTSKKGLVLYYSFSGNTKAIVKIFDEIKFDVVNVREVEERLSFDKYDVIVFATSTWGRGIPPKPFFKIRDDIASLTGKSIGLFGSGRSEYEFFCGALDLLEELIGDKNKIIFKYKFEGYPKELDFAAMKENIKILEELL